MIISDSDRAIDLYALIFGDPVEAYQRRYAEDPEAFSIELAS